MFCTKCGNQIKDRFKFCPKCGTPVYIEKEKPQSELKKEEVGEVFEETCILSEHDAVSSEEIKVSETKSKETETNDTFIPNPLLSSEMDIEGVKKMVDQGDKAAMLKQAFRYENGIGVENDIKKAEELYGKVGGKNIILKLESRNWHRVFRMERQKKPSY